MSPVLALMLVAGGGYGADSTEPEATLGARLPPRLESWFAEALRDPRPGRLQDLDALLDRVPPAQGAGYTWRHYYTYCAAVHAAFAGADARARLLFDKYLEGVGALGATNRIPPLVLACPALKSTRKTIADYRESVSRRWGDDRWSLHNFRSGQLGWEYESALALRSLVTGVRELPDWIARSEVEASSPAGTCRGATVDARRLGVAQRCRHLGDAASFHRLLTRLRNSESSWPVPERLLARIESPPRVVLGLRVRAVWAVALVLAALAATILRLRARQQRRTREGSAAEVAGGGAFDIARTDPWVRWVCGWLGLGSWGVAVAGLVFMGGAHWLLAWSEETLWPQGFVVDRSFLDYFSFPYSFALLIPAFLGGSLLFYSSVRRWLPGVLRVSLEGGEPLASEARPRPMTHADQRNRGGAAGPPAFAPRYFGVLDGRRGGLEQEGPKLALIASTFTSRGLQARVSGACWRVR